MKFLTEPWPCNHFNWYKRNASNCSRLTTDLPFRMVDCALLNICLVRILVHVLFLTDVSVYQYYRVASTAVPSVKSAIFIRLSLTYLKLVFNNILIIVTWTVRPLYRIHVRVLQKWSSWQSKYSPKLIECNHQLESYGASLGVTSSSCTISDIRST
jgi:hypothetical protein